jgi:hypothetical protein
MDMWLSSTTAAGRLSGAEETIISNHLHQLSRQLGQPVALFEAQQGYELLDRFRVRFEIDPIRYPR